MKQREFERLYEKPCLAFEALLEALENPKKQDAQAVELSTDDFPRLYRSICLYHGLAKSRAYTQACVDRLAGLVVRGHRQVYQGDNRIDATGYVSAFFQFFVVEFPALIRQHAVLLGLASALLYLPALLFGVACLIQPDLIYSLHSSEQVANFEAMYDPSNRIVGEARDAEANWLMFGFYIKNNIGVAFQTFASGIFIGIGTAFYLVTNGLLLGGVASHLTTVGFSETFFSFVIGHGSFELTAIAIAGMAGLKMGMGILYPGNLTRKASLQASAKVAVRLIYGVIAMLLIAAFIEAFWSSNNILLPPVKYGVGVFLWCCVAAYFIFSGRSVRSVGRGGSKL